MARVIPVELGTQNQELVVSLDGVDYTLRLLWQDRDESWYLDFSTGDGTPIWMGQRVATRVPLLFQCSNPRKPPGELVVVDTLNEDKDPGLDDFGDDPARIQLVYLEAADVAEALA